MIKQSSLLKWSLNNKSSKGNRNWIHQPEALQSAHVAYLVKFLGKTDARQPKGIEVIKDGIQKLKFNHQLKRSEGGKIPKVELTVSIDGVSVQDPKTKQIFYQYPLHRISYCADDKSDKKFFSFIAKEPDSDKHCCFVFISDKLAEEITLTIGQAFDLAYRRFLETSGRELEMRKRIMLLQKRVQDLEMENNMLQKKLKGLQELKLSESNKSASESKNGKILSNGPTIKKIASGTPPAIQPPPPVQHRHSEGRMRISSQSQNLLCDFKDVPDSKKKNDNDFLSNMAELSLQTNGNITNGLNNNCCASKNGNELFNTDAYGQLQSSVSSDPFGMGSFGTANLHGQELENAIGAIDRRLLEMRDGFQRGLSFGNDDFSTECFEAPNK